MDARTQRKAPAAPGPSGRDFPGTGAVFVVSVFFSFRFLGA